VAKWLDVVLFQEPFPIGADASGRARLAFNILVTKTVSDTFAEEIVSILTAAGVGTYGTNIFIGDVVDIPTGDGPYLSVMETGGLSGLRIHEQTRPAYSRPGAQLIVRATTYDAARTMARAAHNALAAVSNAVVTP
jgi:hypothetical protein